MNTIQRGIKETDKTYEDVVELQTVISEKMHT